MHVLILNIEFIYCTYNSIKKEIAISLMFIKGMLESQTGSYYIYMIVVFLYGHSTAFLLCSVGNRQ